MRLALVVLAALVTLGPAVQAQQPNIVLIYTDDQRFDELDFMPNVQRLLAEGVSLTRFYAATPACCPARATILRGQHAHSHGVLTSKGAFRGGWDEWRRLDRGSSTLPMWLQEAGYRTGFYGKYINGYPSLQDTTYVPPGWDDFLGGYMRLTRGAFFDWRANDNGTRRQWGFEEEDYRTDVEGGYLTRFITRSLDEGRPFFAWYAPIAPHAIAGSPDGAVPPTPAPRHEGMFADMPGLRRPSFDEADVSDKTRFLDRFERLSAAEIERIDSYRRTRAESMMAVDEVLGDVLDLLAARGALDDTYIVFTSDNGFHLGEHRLPPERKGYPYEESVRMPVVIRGPEIPPGSRVDDLLGNVDLAQTFAAWAGAQTPDFVEGRSFADRIVGGEALPPFRTALLNERWNSSAGAPLYFESVVTRRYKLSRWSILDDGSIELYDLAADPGELRSIHAERPGLADSLAAVLDDLSGCAGAECRVADRLWRGGDLLGGGGGGGGAGGPADADTTGVEFEIVGPYPNPARESIAVRLRAPEASVASLRIVNALGQTLARARRLFDGEGTVVRFPVAAFAAGVYSVEIDAEPGGRTRRSFVVRR